MARIFDADGLGEQISMTTCYYPHIRGGIRGSAVEGDSTVGGPQGREDSGLSAVTS